jgi:hypothetical protein
MTGVKRLGNVYRKPPTASTLSLVPSVIGFAYDENGKGLYVSNELGQGEVDWMRGMGGEFNGLVVCPAIYNTSVFDVAVLMALKEHNISVDGIYLVNSGAVCSEDFNPDEFRERKECKPDLDVLKKHVKNNYLEGIESGSVFDGVQKVVVNNRGVVLSELEFLYGMRVESFPHMFFSSAKFSTCFSRDSEFVSHQYSMGAPKIDFLTGVHDGNQTFGRFMEFADSFQAAYKGFINLVGDDEIDHQLGRPGKQFTGQAVIGEGEDGTLAVIESAILTLESGGCPVVVGNDKDHIGKYDKNDLRLVTSSTF